VVRRDRCAPSGTTLAVFMILLFRVMIKNNFTTRLTCWLLPVMMTLLHCGKADSPQVPTDKFETTPVISALAPGLIDEVSGIADSKANGGHLWVQQDSGNPNEIILLSPSAEVSKRIFIKSAINRDWEDLALANGPIPGINYIYVADIGDNNTNYPNYAIYRFPEPPSTIDTVATCETIRFMYPDGPHDAEAILVGNTNEIYIITKKDALSRIYKIDYPQSTTGMNMAVYVGSLSFNGVTSAAISPTGSEIMIRTYTSIHYWNRDANESLEQALSKDALLIGHQLEPQGEAICFRNDNGGFYTISERPSFITSVGVNFYPRK
jgi:hypothetical protein